MVFTIVPAPAKAIWILAVVGVVLVGVIALLAWVAYASQRATFSVTPEGLRISGDPYGRTLPRSDLLVDSASIVSLGAGSEYRPIWRRNGTGLGSYSAGWFRLANGDKALLFVTDRSRVVRVPTTLGYSVFMTVDRPEAMIDALHGLRR